jgi:hypothetical protein
MMEAMHLSPTQPRESSLPPLGFAGRIGGILVEPRRTLARLAAGELRAGDIGWLVLAWLVAAYLPQLVHAALLGRAVGVEAGFQAVLSTVSALLPDVLGILVAGIVMSFFLPRSARSNALDLAAYAWIPYLAVQLAGSFVFTLRGRAASPLVQELVTAAGLVWALVIWALALAAAKDAVSPPPSGSPPAAPAHPGAGS